MLHLLLLLYSSSRGYFEPYISDLERKAEHPIWCFWICWIGYISFALNETIRITLHQTITSHSVGRKYALNCREKTKTTIQAVRTKDAQVRKKLQDQTYIFNQFLEKKKRMSVQVIQKKKWQSSIKSTASKFTKIQPIKAEPSCWYHMLSCEKSLVKSPSTICCCMKEEDKKKRDPQRIQYNAFIPCKDTVKNYTPRHTGPP